MRDEISFRSLVVKSNNETIEENQNLKNLNNQNLKNSDNDLNFFLNKQKSDNSNLPTNINNNNTSVLITQNKSDSKIIKVKTKIKEYFEINKQLNKKDFNSFIKYIGLNDIWSSEEQTFLWDTIITKAKKEDNIGYEETLSSICEFFEYEEDEDEEIIDKKSAYFEKISNSYLDVSQNENYIDEYLNSIKDNIKLLFAIKFINEIFLKNNISNYNNPHYSINTINTMNVNNSITNDDLEKSDGEEVIQIDNNKYDKKHIINLNEIMSKIDNKYRFILIDYEELNNYFNNLNKNTRKSESLNNIILNNDKKQEICLDKELINYVGAMIEFKLENKIKNESRNIDEENNILNSDKEIIKVENIENNYKKRNNKDINTKEKDEISSKRILEELNKLDIMVSDSYEAITNFNNNKSLINLIKLFYEKYIMTNKKLLYEEINQIYLENKKYSEQKNKKEESEIKFNNENSQNLSRSKILLIPDDENDYLKQQNENLKERNEYLQKENAELKENISKNINEISSNKNKIIITKLNLGNNIQNNSNMNLYSNRNAKHFRNKTVGDENNFMNNIINQNNLKNNQNNFNNSNNNSNLSNNANNTNSILNTESDQNISNTNNNNPNNTNNNSTTKNILQFTKTNTNSFLDCNLEEISNSHSEMFSIIGNNTTLNDKFLFETTVLGNNQNDQHQGTPTLTPRSNLFDIKDENNLSYINFLTSNSKTSDYNNDSVNFGKNLNLENKKRSICKNKINEKININENNTFKNKFSFAMDNNINTGNTLDYKNTSDKKRFYDFKYLFQNRKIMKLLMYNNEKIKSSELFSDQIYFILNGNKKKKGILLITSQCFYILNDSEDMNCEIRINHNLLLSVSIPQENFNHLLLFFSDNSYIVIEIYRRIHLLNYIKDLYLYKNKKLDIYICESFNLKLTNNHSFIYDFKNNKEILLTPNFENAQKMGFLSKYKENIFSAYFSEKLVVLCSIGLIVFSKSNINVPKLIIPIISSTIRPMTANANEKLFCFKIKTVNNETFIFGSQKNREINDWIQELKNYQKKYDEKMNEIMANFNIYSNKIN